MSINRISVLLLLIASIGASWSPEAAAQSYPETSADRDVRMSWWRDARFGMFIHWGLYAIPAGEWNGKQVPGIGEWIMGKGQIEMPAYEPLAELFDPTAYDPAAWARMAKDAGMKYLVITSKHHDGFCLFDTSATDWDVVDRTPHGEDLLVPLAEECRRQGVVFCTYYSILDWSHPSQTRVPGTRGHHTTIDPSRKAEYIAYMKTQLKELLDTCDPALIWFDGEWVEWWTEEDGQDMYAYLRGLKAELIINNRVGKGRQGMHGFSKTDRKYAGDFGTPEQQIPETGMPGLDWESCMTMNDTWGYKKNDDNWKSSATLIGNLIDTASKGGNFLLNVGPMADGAFPPETVERLADMGRWMDEASESIYRSAASPHPAPAWGRYTVGRRRGQAALYAHVLRRPADNAITVPGGQVAPEATLISTGESLGVERADDGWRIRLPARPGDATAEVVRLLTP